MKRTIFRRSGHRKITYSYLLILLFFLLLGAGKTRAAAKEPYLRQLDSLISQSSSIDKARDYRIKELTTERNGTHTTEDRYWANNHLYDAYFIVNADSALKYLDDNFRIASITNDHERLADLKIKKSFILTASGLFNEALDELSSIEPSSLTLQLKKDFYSQMISLYGLWGNYSDTPGSEWNNYYKKEQEYKDSLQKVLTPEDNLYLFYQGWRMRNMPAEQQDSVISLLVGDLDSSSLDSRRDAMNAYVLGILFKERGNYEKYLEYITKSAIVDVRIGNRDIASLQELSKILYDEGDIERAYNYITYCLNSSLEYPNRVRALTLLPLQKEINTAYQDIMRSQQSKIRNILIALCIVAGGLVVALIIIVVQIKRLRNRNREVTKINELLHLKNNELEKARESLAESNRELQELNHRLQKINDDLKEANYVKEEYVGYVFAICSHYIKKIEDLRSSLNTKVKKKAWKEIEAETSSHQVMAKKELKEFQENFDSIFLHIFPDFVNDFNTLLLPEERIILKEDEMLNTELRIYALVRLGITDSVKIAEFLHCSPQTVYNYRFKIRNKALIPKENFAEAVKNIGKANIR